MSAFPANPHITATIALFVDWRRSVRLRRGLPLHPVADPLADKREEHSGREPVHENARQSLEWREHSPQRGQHEIAVSDGCIVVQVIPEK